MIFNPLTSAKTPQSHTFKSPG